jgi:hypothetical protein
MDWRIDLDGPSGGGDYMRQKDPTDFSGWIDIIVEDDFDDNGCTGQQFRLQESLTGWSSSFGVDPITENFVIHDLRFGSAQWYVPPSQYDNNESVYLQDIVA